MPRLLLSFLPELFLHCWMQIHPKTAPINARCCGWRHHLAQQHFVVPFSLPTLLFACQSLPSTSPNCRSHLMSLKLCHSRAPPLLSAAGAGLVFSSFVAPNKVEGFGNRISLDCKDEKKLFWLIVSRCRRRIHTILPVEFQCLPKGWLSTVIKHKKGKTKYLLSRLSFLPYT